MPSSRVAIEFMEKCRAAASADAVRDVLFADMAAMGFAYVACCSHVDPLRPPPGAVNMINYPAAWLARFSAENYAAHDPVFMAARTSAVPFFWDDVLKGRRLTRLQRDILQDAAAIGLANGLTIPIHSPGALPASCSLVPGPDGVDPLQVPAVFLMAVYAHERARALLDDGAHALRPALSARERECLALAGAGKSDWVIGRMLGIHERTVHNTIERAKKRYGVAFRVQAVVRAVLDGQIRIDDLAD
ncbi:MAG: LuxR family transcriptional regulator [Hyphomonadaceae bacterium]|nr:LuxR family transcriptional regulator [Hyphomonadaceae bacterium]